MVSRPEYCQLYWPVPPPHSKHEHWKRALVDMEPPLWSPSAEIEAPDVVNGHDRSSQETSTILKMKGLPYTTSTPQVEEFFAGYIVKSVAFVYEPDGRPSGLVSDANHEFIVRPGPSGALQQQCDEGPVWLLVLMSLVWLPQAFAEFESKEDALKVRLTDAYAHTTDTQAPPHTAHHTTPHQHDFLLLRRLFQKMVTTWASAMSGCCMSRGARWRSKCG